MPIRYKTKYSSAQIFKTSSAFLEYRRSEARGAVVCSLSAYKEPKLPGTSSTGRTLYAFYSRCKISASEARVFAESKFSIFWVKKSWHFCQFRLNPSSPSFSLFLSHFLVLGIYWASFPTGPHLCGKRFGELKTYGIRRKNCRWVVEDFHHHFRLNVTDFLSFYPASLT